MILMSLCRIDAKISRSLFLDHSRFGIDEALVEVLGEQYLAVERGHLLVVVRKLLLVYLLDVLVLR